MSKIIVSTLSAGVDFCIYETRRQGDTIVNIPKRKVTIKGGQHVMDGKSLFTPYNGVVTEITDEEYESIKEDCSFKNFIANGFISVINSDSRRAQEKAAADMEQEDDGAQLTAADFSADAAAAGEDISITDGTKNIKVEAPKNSVTKSRKRLKTGR